jgi:hypothetical protein
MPILGRIPTAASSLAALITALPFFTLAHASECDVVADSIAPEMQTILESKGYVIHEKNARVQGGYFIFGSGGLISPSGGESGKPNAYAYIRLDYHTSYLDPRSLRISDTVPIKRAFFGNESGKELERQSAISYEKVQAKLLVRVKKELPACNPNQGDPEFTRIEKLSDPGLESCRSQGFAQIEKLHPTLETGFPQDREKLVSFRVRGLTSKPEVFLLNEKARDSIQELWVNPYFEPVRGSTQIIRDALSGVTLNDGEKETLQTNCNSDHLNSDQFTVFKSFSMAPGMLQTRYILGIYDRVNSEVIFFGSSKGMCSEGLCPGDLVTTPSGTQRIVDQIYDNKKAHVLERKADGKIVSNYEFYSLSELKK